VAGESAFEIKENRRYLQSDSGCARKLERVEIFDILKEYV
jgi:hypothetical protein